MSQIKITLLIDIPEGARVSTPDVDYNEIPVVAQTLAVLGEPPLPPEPTDFPTRQEAFAPKQDIPICPVHQKPLTFRPAGTIKTGPKAGQPRGAFWSCGEKDASGRWCSSRVNAA